MVIVFTNCENCQNNEGCTVRPQLERIHETNNKFVNVDSRISIHIRCNDYQTDYGKGVGM